MPEAQDLLKELNSPDWTVRARTMKNLLEYPQECYLPFIEEALKDHENATLRNASMDFYRTLGDRGLPSLIRLLGYEDPEVRLFSANLLGDIADRRAVSDLIRSLEDADENVRIASAESLGKIGDPCAVPALSGALNDEPWVAMAAINAFGSIGGEDALDILYGCLEKDEYRGMTFEAIEAAGDESAIRRLTTFVLRDEMRELALKSIVNIAVRKRIKPLPDYFINVIPLLLDLQGSQQQEIRKAAFIALAWAEDLKGLAYYIDALNDDELQEYAVKCLLSMGGKAAPEIIDALKDCKRPQRCVLAKILAMIGEQMALIQFSEDRDPEVRVEVAIALKDAFRQIKSPRIFDILGKMQNDPDDEVRMAAQRTIGELRREI